MNFALFTKCSNDATIFISTELDKEVEITCPHHTENDKYCDFKGVCHLKGRFLRKELKEDDIIHKLSFEGEITRGSETNECRLPATTMEELFGVITRKADTVIIIT